MTTAFLGDPAIKSRFVARAEAHRAQGRVLDAREVAANRLLEDEVLTLTEAAAVGKVSPAWLKRSDCPRVRRSNKPGGRGVLRFMKSEVLGFFAAGSTARRARA